MPELIAWAVESSLAEEGPLASLLRSVCERTEGSRFYVEPPDGCEWLDCRSCGTRWARMIVRGVKPHRCPRCAAFDL